MWVREYKEYRLDWHLLCRDCGLKIWEQTEKMRSISVADKINELIYKF